MMGILGYTEEMPPWLAVKLILIVLYIFSGIICFRKSSLRYEFGILSLVLFFAAAYFAINKPQIY